MRPLFLSLALLVAPGAAALAQDACARFEEPLAYNQCLATQGPKAHATRAVDVPAGESTAQGGARRGRVHTLLQVVHRRNGKMFAEFTVGPSRRKKLPDEGAAPSQ